MMNSQKLPKNSCKKAVLLDTGKETISLTIPDNVTFEIMEPEYIKLGTNTETTLTKALNSPIASSCLSDLAFGKKKISIIICDNTRFLPQDIILPMIMAQLELAGIDKKNITIVIATGTHDGMSDDEIDTMIGKNITDKYKIINHDAYDESKLVYLGESKKLSVPIYINKTVVESDLRIGVGTVDPHIFAGYSGGNKILSVGVAGTKTIALTHNPDVMENPDTKFGDIKGNIFREFINEVANIVKLDFLVNVVQNSKKEMIQAFAGDALKAYERAVECAKTIYEAKACKKADVVVAVPKFPKTLNLYQSIRAVNSVVFCKETLVKQDGTVILPAECWKGIGSDDFYNDLANVESPSLYIEKARKYGFPPEGNKAFTVSKVLEKCRIIVTNTKIASDKLIDMHLCHDEDASTALQRIADKNKKPIHVIIMPDGFLTLPVFN